MQYTATASSGATVTFAVETLPQAFATVPDPRRAQGRRYSVAAILSLAVVAVLANHTSVLAMAEWAARQTRHVRRALGFRRDTTPHQTTVQRLFARLNPAAVAVAPEAIGQIDWQCRVLTGDALYCQQALCTQVVEAGGDYLFIVKENQPTLLADIVQVFTPLTAEELARMGVHTVQPLATQTYRTVEKGHGRIEERQIRVSSELAEYSSWPYLVQVFEYTRRWTAKGVTKQQVRHGITSLPATVSDPAQLAALKRGHWQVENGLHYVKDVTLREDASQTHVGRGADILAMVRNTAISLIRRAGHRNIAARLRRYSGCPYEALALLDICVDQNA